MFWIKYLQINHLKITILGLKLDYFYIFSCKRWKYLDSKIVTCSYVTPLRCQQGGKRSWLVWSGWDNISQGCQHMSYGCSSVVVQTNQRTCAISSADQTVWFASQIQEEHMPILVHALVILLSLYDFTFVLMHDCRRSQGQWTGIQKAMFKQSDITVMSSPD